MIELCLQCNGIGFITMNNYLNLSTVSSWKMCENCKGKGYIIKK